MGIYVFNWAFLRDLLIRDSEDPNSSHDFGIDLIPDIVKNGKAMAHRFSPTAACKSGLETEPYWRDVGTIDAFWQANIDLTDFVPEAGPLRQRLADLDLCRDRAPGQVHP